MNPPDPTFTTRPSRRNKTQRQLVRDLLQKAFGGNPGQLVMQALSERKASKQELADIRRLLDKMEGNES